MLAGPIAHRKQFMLLVRETNMLGACGPYRIRDASVRRVRRSIPATAASAASATRSGATARRPERRTERSECVGWRG